MAIAINRDKLGKFGFEMEDIEKVKVIAVDKDGYTREIEYAASDAPEAVMTDLEALDE